MKPNPIRTALEWMLITSLVLSLVFFYRYWNQSSELRMLQVQMQQLALNSQSNYAVVNVLMGECQEYAKTHPDIRPLLEPPRQAASPAAAGAPKPTGK
jgi:hypothetical protein